MKSVFTKTINTLAFLLAISSFWGCTSNKLSKDKAEKLISEKYKLPFSEMQSIGQPQIRIWTKTLSRDNEELNMPTIIIDEIIKSGKFSNISDFNTRTDDDWKHIYIAKGDFEAYKKLKDLGLIKFERFIKVEAKALDSYGNNVSSYYDENYGIYWGCIFSLTPKADELGITNWQYKAADWIFDDITGIITNDAEKTADVEFTLKTANPTPAAKLFGIATEKKQNLKAVFKLYDDGWRIN